MAGGVADADADADVDVALESESETVWLERRVVRSVAVRDVELFIFIYL